MKKFFIRVAAIVLAVSTSLLLASCGNQTREQYPTPTDQFFVNDFAEIMTEADKDTVYTAGAALQQATTAQVVVVTVDSLNGKTIEDYALQLGRDWGVGDKEKNNGVVILLSESDREVYIAVGYGLEGALPDSKTGRIIDTYGISYFSSDNFSMGLVSVYSAIVNEIYIEYGITPAENYVPIDQLPGSESETTTAGEVIISWLVLIVLLSIYVSAFGRRGGLFLFGAPHFFGGSHFNNSNFGGSSGGFGGFSGGGGSFGGGGAGRKF